MKICQRHWDALRKSLADRGLAEFGAKNAQQAIVAAVTDLEGRGAENEFDPLMACNYMIFTEGLKRCGLSLMGVDEQGNHLCPVCESLRRYEIWWIEGPADAMLKEAQEKGLVPKPPEEKAE